MGQIRDKVKVYAETNDPNTVVSPDTLTMYKPVVSKSAKEIGLLDIPVGKTGLLITASDGTAIFFPVPDGDAGKNKVLAIDNVGNLTWEDK